MKKYTGVDMRKLKLITGGFALLASLNTGTAAATQVINFAHALPSNSHFSVGVDAFKERLEQLSSGDFRVVQHSAGSLGGERALIEGLQLGTVEAVMTSTGPLGNFVPEILVFDLPFLFRDYGHARCVLDSEVGESVLGVISQQMGVKAMAWSEAGFRHVTNSVQNIRTPADLSDMKIRTMENQVHMDTFRSLDANPTPMAFPELFTALQQGTVDGQENPITVIVSSRFSEVQQYLSLTGHVYTAGMIMFSSSLYESLNDQQKAWFDEASQAAVQATRDEIMSMEILGVAALKEQGVQVEENVDKDAFLQEVQEVYSQFSEKHDPALLVEVQNSSC